MGHQHPAYHPARGRNSMQWIPWAWAVMALIFLVAEIFTAGFFLICFGIGAAAAAILAFLGVGLVGQLAGFVVVSTLAVILSRPFARRVSGEGHSSFGVDRVLGKTAVVTVAIDPIQARGRVRVDREEWLADSVDGTPIEVGARVEVLGVDGTRLKVRRLADG
uniref:NfeD family protein n=2 Tax=Litorilinea aerophila TaxID=1204385 RepID=A0A540VI19_9CHLR